VRLGAPELERTIRTRVRQELRSSDVLWKEYRRMRKAGRDTRALRILFQPPSPFFFLPFVWFLWVAPLSGFGAERLLLVLSLFNTAIVFQECLVLLRGLCGSPELATFLHLPIGDEEIFRFEWQRCFVRSIWVFYASLVAYGYAAIVRTHSWRLVGLVVLASALQWLTAVALTTLLAKYRPRRSLLAQVDLVLFGMFIVSFFLPLDSIRDCREALLLLPGSWITGGFERGFRNHTEALELLLIAVALVAAFMALMVVRVRKLYSTRNLTISTGSAVTLGDLLEIWVPTAVIEDDLLLGERPSNPGWDAIQASASIDTGQFMAASNWADKGWVERLTAQLLRPADKAVVEFMLGDRLGVWTRRWRTAAMVSAGGIMATVLLPKLPGDLLPFVPMIIAAVIAAPVLGGPWPGFGVRFCAGQWVPIHSVVPVSYWGISRVVFKVNGVRLTTWLPLLFGYALALGWRLIGQPLAGVALGAKAFGLIVALQPAILLAHFFKGTRACSSWLVAICIALCQLILIAAVVWHFIPDPLTTAVVAVTSAVCWALYGILYTRGHADLVRSQAL
jgi:hypothetical protein